MDDDYIIRWVVKILTPSGVAWHEREEICDDLTSAERCFTQAAESHL